MCKKQQDIKLYIQYIPTLLKIAYHAGLTVSHITILPLGERDISSFLAIFQIFYNEHVILQ